MFFFLILTSHLLKLKKKKKKTFLVENSCFVYSFVFIDLFCFSRTLTASKQNSTLRTSVDLSAELKKWRRRCLLRRQLLRWSPKWRGLSWGMKRRRWEMTDWARSCWMERPRLARREETRGLIRTARQVQNWRRNLSNLIASSVTFLPFLIIKIRLGLAILKWCENVCSIVGDRWEGWK